MNFDDYKTVHWVTWINRSIQILLVALLIVTLNYCGAKYFWRHDMTKNHKYSLSPETLAYIKHLDKPVHIIVTLAAKPGENNETDQIYMDIKNLLREYDYAGSVQGENKITTECVHIFQDRKRAEELVTTYNIQHGNSVIVTCGTQYREIMLSNLYEVNKKQKVQAFKGESLITSAILDVSSETKQKIYFAIGHGEMQANDTDAIRGLSEIAQSLIRANKDLAMLDLKQGDNIPEDADLIIIASPQASFLPKEVEKLRHYLWTANGNVLIFVDAGNPHGLNVLFEDWHIKLEDRVILDIDDNKVSEEGDLLIKNYGKHPTTEFLENYQLSILAGLCRPVMIHAAGAKEDQLKVSELLWSSATSWARPFYGKLRRKAFDSENDIKGPLPLAVLLERSIQTDLGMRIPGGKLLVMGNADFLANNRIHALGNTVFFQNVIYTILDHPYLLNIPPKKIDIIQLALSESDLFRLAMHLALLPLGVSIIGLINFFMRKR